MHDPDELAAESLAAALLAAWDAGGPMPAALTGTLALADAYAVQVRVLHKRLAAGSAQAGWKIGLTSAAMRAARGETQLAPGFLLAAGERPDGGTLQLGAANGESWFLEVELAFVIGAELAGPGATAETVRASVSHVAPAFELVRQRAGWADPALQRAVNAANAGYVLGPRTEGCPSAPEIDALRVTAVCDGPGRDAADCDGASRLDVRGGDVNDNPLESTAWLVNFLAGLGESLRPGHVILTGSYSPLLPLRAGQQWRAELGGLGQVALDIG